MKITLIGNRSIATFYLKTLENFNVEQLVCSASSKTEKIGKVCFINDYKNDKILTSDIVIIGTPPASHYKLVEYFLQRDKNIVVEKSEVISTKQLKDLHKIMTSRLYFAYHLETVYI